MPDYGQSLLDDGLERLRGTWEYRGEEYDLLVEDISYPDWQLVQQYAAIAGQVQSLDESGGEISDDVVDSLTEQAENLDNFSWEDGGDADFVESVINAKLLAPEVDLQQTSQDKISALIEGMMQTWSRATDVEQAEGEMPIEGNT
jgi:hypothetical protein